jgi:FkbM family methyltransferase
MKSSYVNLLKRIIGKPLVCLASLMLNFSSNWRLVEVINLLEGKFPNWFVGIKKTITVNTDFGFNLIGNKKELIVNTIIRQGQWEAVISGTMQACLRKGDIAVDIGANIGYYTVMMSKRVGGSGMVIAFEPVLTNFNLLQKNIQLNNINNVSTQNIALSDSAGFSEIYVWPEAVSSGSTLRKAAQANYKQPVILGRLDDFIKLPPGGRIRVVKIDVEGHECKVFKGMLGLLNKIDYVISEINHTYLEEAGDDYREIFDIMAAHGFSNYYSDGAGVLPWKEKDNFLQTKNNKGEITYYVLFYRELTDRVRQFIA